MHQRIRQSISQKFRLCHLQITQPWPRMTAQKTVQCGVPPNRSKIKRIKAKLARKHVDPKSKPQIARGNSKSGISSNHRTWAQAASLCRSQRIPLPDSKVYSQQMNTGCSGGSSIHFGRTLSSISLVVNFLELADSNPSSLPLSLFRVLHGPLAVLLVLISVNPLASLCSGLCPGTRGVLRLEGIEGQPNHAPRGDLLLNQILVPQVGVPHEHLQLEASKKGLNGVYARVFPCCARGVHHQNLYALKIALLLIVGADSAQLADVVRC